MFYFIEVSVRYAPGEAQKLKAPTVIEALKEAANKQEPAKTTWLYVAHESCIKDGILRPENALFEYLPAWSCLPPLQRDIGVWISLFKNNEIEEIKMEKIKSEIVEFELVDELKAILVSVVSGQLPIDQSDNVVLDAHLLLPTDENNFLDHRLLFYDRVKVQGIPLYTSFGSRIDYCDIPELHQFKSKYRYISMRFDGLKYPPLFKDARESAKEQVDNLIKAIRRRRNVLDTAWDVE